MISFLSYCVKLVAEELSIRTIDVLIYLIILFAAGFAIAEYIRINDCKEAGMEVRADYTCFMPTETEGSVHKVRK